MVDEPSERSLKGLLVDRSPDGVTTLTINRPERANSLDDDLLMGLSQQVLDLASETGVRALVLTGAGKHFCSGADLSAGGFDMTTVEDSAAYARRTHATPFALRTASVPTIAAVNGAAVGGGFGMALSCDLRIASPQARFIAPFVSMGMTPHYGVSYFLPRIVGEAAALDIILSARTVAAEEALSLGIVSEVAEDPVKRAMELASTYARQPANAAARAKTLIMRALDSDLFDHVLDYEPMANAVALHGPEFAEKFDAYQRRLKAGKAG